MSNFLITGSARTGTTLLVNSLAQHPQVTCDYELFNPSQGNGFYDTLFTSDIVNGLYDGKDHYGFKLLYHQGRDTDVWDITARMKDLGVIHMVRPNTLHTLASLHVARLTQKWNRKLSEKQWREPPRIELTVRECEYWFGRYAKERERVVRVYDGHPFLEITYPDLSEHYRDKMAEVFTFVGVEPVVTKQHVVKMETQPMSERIINYWDLKRHFWGTEYAWFFTGVERPMTIPF